LQSFLRAKKQKKHRAATARRRKRKVPVDPTNFPRRPTDPSNLLDLEYTLDAVMKKMPTSGRLHLQTLEDLCEAAGIHDKNYVDACISYSTRVDDLDARLEGGLRRLGLPAVNVPRQAEALPMLSREEVRQRILLARGLYLDGVLMSLSELGKLLCADCVQLEGFAVNGCDTPFISPLLDSIGQGFARSMVISRVHRRELGANAIRVDASTLPGHWAAWDHGLRGEDEKERVKRTAIHVLGGGFSHVITAGGVAAKCISAVSAVSPSPAVTVHQLVHPVNLLPTYLNHLPTVLAWAEEYDTVAALVGGGTGPSEGAPGLLYRYCQAMAQGAEDKKHRSVFGVARAVKAARKLELKRGKPVPWEELLPMVQLDITLRTGAIDDTSFYALGWTCKHDRAPHSPNANYLSANGTKGGRRIPIWTFFYLP
jgi:hypothetical protein